jgi:hypothetical protein
MKIYRGFPRRLDHTVPHWVEPGALFHIRIALDREKEQRALTDAALAQVRHGESVLWRTIFDSAKFYQTKVRWHITLFLLMPDHLHALLFFRAQRTDERSHQRLETFSCANESRHLAGRIFSIIVCELMNAARSSQPRWITSGRILWLPVCARNRKTGRGLSIHSHASIEDDAKINRPVIAGRKILLPEHCPHEKVGRQSRIYF